MRIKVTLSEDDEYEFSPMNMTGDQNMLTLVPYGAGKIIAAALRVVADQIDRGVPDGQG